MKRQTKALLTAIAITVLSWASSASAFDFGTKFVCCRPQSMSCLGGGGSTTYARTLRDRALTQVDAKARCGFDQMYWGTHSCPADVPCSNPNPGGPVTPASSQVNFTNNRNQDVFVALKTWSGNRYEIHAWYKVGARQRREFPYSENVCIAISVDGRDYIQDQRNAGSIFTGTVSNLKVHPQRKTDLSWGLEGNNRFYVTLAVDGIFSQRTYHNYTADNVRALMDQNGLTSFLCHQQLGRSNFFVSAD